MGLPPPQGLPTPLDNFHSTERNVNAQHVST